MNKTEKYINTPNSLSLWSESFGESSDPAILLIMGAMNQGIFWPDEFCNKLALSKFYVIRYDHRDTGKSYKVDFEKNPYDLNDLAEDVIAVLNGHNKQNAILIGLSMGGYIAQIMAIRYPKIVNKLVLISTTADHRPYMTATMGQAKTSFNLPYPENKLLEYIALCKEKALLTDADIEESVIQGWKIMYSSNRPFPEEQLKKTLRLAAERSPDQSKGFNHALAVAASPDRLEAIKTIQAPTLIIHGKFDPCFPLEHGKYLADNISDAQLKVLEMGHAFQWAWSEEIGSCINNFTQKSGHNQ